MNPVRAGAIRRLVMPLFLASLASPGFSAAGERSGSKTGTLFTIDARAPESAPETGYLQMGSGAAGESPTGRVLSVNSRYLTLDGRPWLPVMGEFHYSRYPARYWEEEILKMKAGGVQIIATYVFWIHHEEVEGQFDWSGQRDLRRFVELGARHGMYVVVRLGPWAHGEARNGGLPDWLLEKGPTRVSDPVYLTYVHKYYDEIGRQLKGLLWKDGGPIIGVQIENEYTNRAPNAGAAHIATLKGMAIEAGFDVPIYTVTGWDNAVYPPRTVIPVFGGYPDEPWAGSREDLPPDTQGVYQFAPTGGNAGILQGVTTASEDVPLWHYPRFTGELGGGMQLTYHRRVVVAEDDIPPMALTTLGSGVNLLGYYMFHGGTNPDGKLSTLQESQVTGYPNDVPVKSYDFQAPLREYGQMSGSFRKLRMIHQFIHDFGSDLAPMTRVLPDIVPSGMQDTTTLRVAARTHGDCAFLFFNNYLRHYPLPEKQGVQAILKLPSETITLPREPVNVASQSAFVWPVNLDLNGALLKYATAQPLAKIDAGPIAYYFFTPSAGIAPEFAFAAATVSALNAKSGVVSRQDERIYVSGSTPSTGVAMEIRTRAGKTVRIVLLSAEQAQNAWKVAIAGHERMLISAADVFADGKTIHLRSRTGSTFAFSLFPEVGHLLTARPPLRESGVDGVFRRHSASVAAKEIRVQVERIRQASATSPVRMGPFVDWRGTAVALAPEDVEFAKAGVWRVILPKDALEGVSDVFLDVNYVGDVGRLYGGSRLLDDNFFNGTAWQIGLKRYEPETLASGLSLQILPLRKDAPIYVPKGAWPDFGARSEVAEVESVGAFPEYELTLTWP